MPKKITGNTKKARKAAKKRRELILAINPAIVPLCEVFAVVDDVFTTEDAFSEANIHKSLGRIYRQWKSTRSELDEDFDPKRYPKKQRATKVSAGKKVKLQTKGK